MKATNNNNSGSGKNTTPSGQAGHPSKGGELATDGQVRYLHVLYRQLYLNDELYRDMLRHNYGVSSTKDLTKGQAFTFITKLQTIVDQLDDHITPKQIYLVRQLWAVIDYAKGAEGDVYLNKFIRKYYRKGVLADLTKHEAIRLIKQIGQMTKQAEERRGKTTVLRRKTKCVHCGQLIMWVQLKDERREAFDCDENNNPTDFHKCR